MNLINYEYFIVLVPFEFPLPSVMRLSLVEPVQLQAQMGKKHTPTDPYLQKPEEKKCKHVIKENSSTPSNNFIFHGNKLGTSPT